MPIKKIIQKLTLVLAFAGLSSCALAEHGAYNPMAPRQLHVEAVKKDYSFGLSILPGNAVDALEFPNRYIGFAFNYYVLDRYLLRPLAHGYAHLPDFVQTGVGNFFSNIDDLTSVVNHVLLAEPGQSGVSLGRFVINSTIGILGLIDVASMMGIPKQQVSMSTTFGRYGVDQGAFVMMPGMGMKTMRSLHGDTLDNWPYWFYAPIYGLVAWVINGIHYRAQYIAQEAVVDNSIDPYSQTRQIYLMYQQGLVEPDSAAKPQEEAIDQSFLDEIDNM